MNTRLMALGIIAAALNLSGCGNAEKEAQEARLAKQAEVERVRLASLTPEQRKAEDFKNACDKAKAQFQVCEGKTGNAYVNCLADIDSAPEGCGEVSLQDMADHAAGTVKHK